MQHLSPSRRRTRNCLRRTSLERDLQINRSTKSQTERQKADAPMDVGSEANSCADGWLKKTGMEKRTRAARLRESLLWRRSRSSGAA